MIKGKSIHWTYAYDDGEYVVEFPACMQWCGNIPLPLWVWAWLGCWIVCRDVGLCSHSCVLLCVWLGLARSRHKHRRPERASPSGGSKGLENMAGGSQAPRALEQREQLSLLCLEKASRTRPDLPLCVLAPMRRLGEAQDITRIDPTWHKNTPDFAQE